MFFVWRTVIRFVSISAKFGISSVVVGLNGALVEAKKYAIKCKCQI